MCAQKEINWLHISDLHIGARGSKIMNQISMELLPIFKKQKTIHTNPPEIILISGDIANSGKTKEYEEADVFLNDLLSDLRSVYGNKIDPLIIPVPGNHDLIRPQEEESLDYYLFNDYASGTEDNKYIKLFNQLLETGTPPNRLSKLFLDYAKWSNKYIEKLKTRKGVTVYESHIPGDLCVLLNSPFAFPFCIVGMNSAWLQFSGDEFKGKLSIPLAQFNALLPRCEGQNPLSLFKEYERAIFMMHHPPTWLSSQASKVFFDGIYRSERFDICLFGHMHNAKSQASSVNTEPMYYEYQSPSLCGLEHYGKKNEERLFGFTFGAISEEGEIRAWPYQRQNKGGKQSGFDLNHNLINTADNTLERGAVIRPVNSQLERKDSIEGIFIRIVPISSEQCNNHVSIKPFLDARLPDIIEKLGIIAKVEPFECSSSNECVFYLPYSNNQTWSIITYQAFQILLELLNELQKKKNGTKNIISTTQYGFTMHTEEGGTGQFIYHSNNSNLQSPNKPYHISLPKLTRPSFLMSEKIYHYLLPFLSDEVSLTKTIIKTLYLSERLQPPHVDIQPIMRVPISKAELTRKKTDQSPSMLYNLYISTNNNERILGDLYLPAGYLRMDCMQSASTNNFVEQLVDAERVWIIGINNQDLLISLKSAYEKRKKLNRKFWKEFRIVFLARKLTKLIINKPINKIDTSQEKDITDWYLNMRSIREFLLKTKDDETENLDCLQLDYLLPFEANFFCDSNGNSTIQMFPFLSSM
ncbi:MAG: metallophosphoesterase, partial [Anaerolineaceae bacterium]|nr:metallophosphoesterase [Anaerolineaceae bacterium]